jgi:hypothetical protein
MFVLPNNTLGSLQTYLTTFDLKSQLPREINDLLTAASNSIQGLSEKKGASKKGQEMIRHTVMQRDQWQSEHNLFPAALRVATEAAKTK